MSKTKYHEYLFCSYIINNIMFINEAIAKGYTLMYSLNALVRQIERDIM